MIGQAANGEDKPAFIFGLIASHRKKPETAVIMRTPLFDGHLTMKWMNFIPFLTWMLLFWPSFAFAFYKYPTNSKIERTAEEEKNSNANIGIWLFLLYHAVGLSLLGFAINSL